MSGRTIARVFFIIAGVIVVAAGSFLAYIWFSGGSGEPSAGAEATALEPERVDAVVYEVASDRSEARFLIEEVLRGVENTVVGTTNQIDGSLAVDFASGEIEVGEFVINVRTIATDDEIRDRTIRTLILESNQDEYEFAVFTPVRDTADFDGLAVGQVASFQVTGDLTIRDVTSRVTFTMSVALDSEEAITGRASTTISWDDFDITIPYVGGNSIVASVGDTVDLEMEFAGVARE
ncbi:MAG: YceI family protein [Spirochaetales bacterium]|nr:YceI family protein [Spirochaetales bacterium]